MSELKGRKCAVRNQHVVFSAACCRDQGARAELLQKHKSSGPSYRFIGQAYWKCSFHRGDYNSAPFPPLIRSLVKVCKDTEHPPLRAVPAACKYDNLLTNIFRTKDPLFSKKPLEMRWMGVGSKAAECVLQVFLGQGRVVPKRLLIKLIHEPCRWYNLLPVISKLFLQGQHVYLPHPTSWYTSLAM